MKIHPSKTSCHGKFREFWNAALAYQSSNQLPLWSSYPEERIDTEIQEGRHYSAFMPDGVLGGYFSVAFSDELIWSEKEKGDAIYLHRICVNPNHKGNTLTSYILSWAYGYALGSGRKFIRMDTWGDNQRLVNYYISCGFQYVGNRRLGVVPELPPHYNNANLALFENHVSPIC